jgi:hypothetical protein
MKFDHIITPELRLLESLQRGADPLTRKNLQIMHENFVVPYSKYLKSQFTLMEAEMTADQIQQVFGHAERIASAGGDNKTMLGKGADAAGAAAGAIGQGAVAAGKGAADLAVKGAKGAKDLAAKLVPDAVKKKFEASLPAPDAGPVEGFEQKATQAIANIEDPKAKQSLMDKIKIGLKNPVTQQLIMAGVSGIAGIIASTATAGLGGYAGAAAAGAITGSLLGGINAKLQGGSWKDAGKAALKGAAVGATAGLIGKGVTDVASAGMDAYNSHQQQQATAGEDPMKADNDLYGPGGAADEKILPVTGKAPGASLSVGQQLPDGEVISGLDSSNPNAAVTITKPDGGTYTVSRDTAHNMTGQQGISNQATAGGPVTGGASSDPMAGVSNTPPAAPAPAPSQNVGDSDFSQAEINAPIPVDPKVQQLASQEAAKYGRSTPNQDDIRAAQTMAQGKPAGNYTPTGNAYVDHLNQAAANGIRLRGIQKQSRVNTGTPVIEYIDRELTARMWILHESVGKPRGNVHLTEAGIGDMFKKAGNWLKTKAGNLTNKVTADKLQQAWTKAGSPTDSGQVAAIMVQAGVPQDSIDQIFKNMGLPDGSSKPTAAPAPAAAPAKAAGPKQGLIGKAAGAVGGAIGSVKGAIAGAKDAFAQGKETGFDTSRANQAGDAVGATGEANPYAKGAQQPAPGQAEPAGTPQQTGGQTPAQGQAAPAGGAQQPAQAAAGGAPAGTPQQTGGQAPAQGQAAPAGGETPDDDDKEKPNKYFDPKGLGDYATGLVKDAEGAMKAGVGMGTAGQSLMQTGSNPADPKNKDQKKTPDSVTIKDAQGIEHSYKKVGQQWFDKDNKPVNTAQAAMLDQHAKQQAALGAEAPAPEPEKKLDNPKDPKTGKPIDPKAQAAAGGAAGGAQQPDKMLANPKDPKTGKPIDPKAQAAAGGAQQPAQAAAGGAQQPAQPAQPAQAAAGQKPAYDTQTGVANDAMKAVNKAAGKAAAPNGFNTQTGEPNPAPGQSETGEVSPEYRARQKAVMTPGTPEHSAIQDQIIANADENKLRVFAASAQTPGTKEKAAAELKRRGLSVEEPAAAGGAQQPAQAQSPEEIRKAKQAGAAKTAQDQMAANAAAPAGQAAPAAAAAKAHTGGKVAGQVSQTPNAIRKREQRAAAAAQKAAPNDVMARMAKQLAPAQPAATPNFGQQQTGYASVKMNAPTGIPQQPAVQPTTGAKAVPAQQPAAAPAAAPTASAQADAGKPGFLQSKIKGSQVPAKQPEMAGMDFSAMLARKAKIRL